MRGQNQASKSNAGRHDAISRVLDASTLVRHSHARKRWVGRFRVLVYFWHSADDEGALTTLWGVTSLTSVGAGAVSSAPSSAGGAASSVAGAAPSVVGSAGGCRGFG